MSKVFFRDEKKKKVLHHLLSFPEASVLNLMSKFSISRASAYRYIKLSDEEKLRIIDELTHILQKDTSILDNFIIQNCQVGFEDIRELHARFKTLGLGYDNYYIFEHEFEKALLRIKLTNRKAFRKIQYDSDRNTYFCLITSPFDRRTKKTVYHS